MQYSIKKGLWKGLKTILLVAVTAVSVSTFADIDLWQILVTYVKPVLSGVTVLGALTMLLNYVKVKSK